MVNRIATFPATDRLILDNLRMQSQLADTQTQLATGLKSLNYKGIASETQRLLNIERNFTSLQNYNINSNMVVSNVDIMYTALGSMNDLANNFMSTLTSALSGNFMDSLVNKNQAEILLNEMEGLLNTQSAGRFLFAGSTIDVKPVSVTDPSYPLPTTPSVADMNYYSGDDVVMSVQTSETQIVNYGITANHPAFEKVLRALRLVSANPADVATITEASTLMSEGIHGMANISSQLSTFSRAINDQILRNEEDMSVMETVIGNLKGVDLAATTVKQKEIETQIEASYASSVRILNLKLTDYI